MNIYTTEMTFYNSVNSGLPSNIVNSIAIDESGVKWIGTVEGLVKYNGTKSTVYNVENSEVEAFVTPHVVFLMALQKKHQGFIKDILETVGNNWSGQIHMSS